jgi:chaperonin GroES
MKMLANNILVDPEGWPTQKLGSIVLPDNQEAKERFARGVVREVGSGLWLHNGSRPPIEVDIGDHVLYFKAGAAKIVVQEKEMHIVQEREIIAILEPGDFGTVNEGESNDASH